MSKDTKVETGEAKELPAFKPTIHLTDKHVPEGVGVGDHVQFQGHGKVMSRGESTDSDGKTSKHATIEVHGMKHKKGKHPVGRAGGKHADMQDGGKAAMDQALTTDADNDGE